MVSDEEYGAMVAENAQLRERVSQLEAALAQALERMHQLEQAQAVKQEPPPFVKANVPERTPQPRKKRAPEHNRGRRREPPTRIVEHRPAQCTTCRGRLSGWTLAGRRQVVEIPPPPPASPVPLVRQALYDRLVASAARLGAQVAQVPGHPCHALAQRLLRHQGDLFTFVRRDDVPADNNAAERGVRPLVVSRKISGGTRSGSGSHTRMVLTSLFETWRAQGSHPLVTCRRLLQGPLPQF